VNISCATVSGVISVFIGGNLLASTTTSIRGSPFGGRMLHPEQVCTRRSGRMRRRFSRQWDRWLGFAEQSGER
jgi:hypothetical protein